MNVNKDLIGKTITGVIASAEPHGTARELWMLQFSDGTHVEFVSPKAKKALRTALNQSPRRAKSGAGQTPQLSLNVA